MAAAWNASTACGLGARNAKVKWGAASAVAVGFDDARNEGWIEPIHRKNASSAPVPKTPQASPPLNIFMPSGASAFS